MGGHQWCYHVDSQIGYNNDKQKMLTEIEADIDKTENYHCASISALYHIIESYSQTSV